MHWLTRWILVRLKWLSFAVALLLKWLSFAAALLGPVLYWSLVRLKWLSFAVALLSLVIYWNGNIGGLFVSAHALLLAIFLSLETPPRR